jgi:hypothetical protein
VAGSHDRGLQRREQAFRLIGINVFHSPIVLLKSLSHYKNQVVHWAIKEEAAVIVLGRLQEQAQNHYMQFEKDNNYVLQWHAYLFTQLTTNSSTVITAFLWLLVLLALICR